MELTAESFNDFVKRLQYHNKGEGVNEHWTANPIFIVQKQERISGFDSQYVDKYEWRNLDDPERIADERMAKRLNKLDDDGRRTDPWEKIYYVERWEYVCAHFTKEAAEAFIRRKGHDYRKLRVYVDAQVYCWEYNAIIKGLLDGSIVFNPLPRADPGAA